jgi:hypothetical protein
MPWDAQSEYLAGLTGCFFDEAVSARFDAMILEQGLSPDGGVICDRYGLAGAGEGKLTALWNIIETVFPGSLPASGQQRGDCVSHGTRNAILGTVAAEIAAGRPDEQTGEIEHAPEQPEEGRKDGVFATETYYWYREHGGDGWQCEAAAEVALKKTGAWVRRNYPELGIDLTRYSGKLAGKYGASPPPDSITSLGRKHLVRTATRALSFEQVRDLLANGYGISSCGSEGFSNQRNEDGVSSRSGTWHHAMAYLGCDDRDVIKAKYGEPLVLVMNSWAKWNSGSRKVLGVDLQIPEGSFWAKWSNLRARSAIAFSGFNGWPAQRLPNWTGGVL